MTEKSRTDGQTTDTPFDEGLHQRASDILDRSPAGAGRESRPDAMEIAGRRSGPRFSKTVVNFCVDAALLALVVSLLFTAAVLRFVFPAPSASAGWILWGYGYDAWSNFQFGLVTVIGLAILLHVMLHWSWVCGVVVIKLLGRPGAKQNFDDGQQTLWGVGMLIVVVNILGLLVGLAYLTIRGPAG